MKVQIFSTLSGMELNEWIKAARLSKKLTQDQLAEALDLTKGNVSAWEVGRHEPSYGTLVKIIEITGFNGPLPGLGAPIVTESEWPFQKVSKEKVVALGSSDRAQLEACIILSAAQLDLDVKK
ncbi:helix-turn-helix transcriptional regulator [Alcaligenaceae bacterium]|nr:helix-turn-helix transcriptional regulator [Alcaligenaceae bacterium]